MPRWGLIDRPVLRLPETESRLQRWAAAAPGLLFLVGGLLGLAAAAELFRYGILLYNRTRLVSPTTLVVSDALVMFAEVASIVIGIAAAIASACWLISRRQVIFERAGTQDPRSARGILVGSLIPILSLAMPGVFLTELVDAKGGSDRPRALVLVRIWWAAWVINWGFVLAAILWRFRDSLQSRADGVLFSALVALVGLAVVLLTIRLIRTIDDQRWRGNDRKAPTRWTVSVQCETEPAAAKVPVS
ncbi:DUF4328 domain-containing protein [Rhodococcus sp. G-MC3]|uniref:DUF4328 domain-containing protein n=1 Tax=Rhodococcus sp. G-MC3 TaxID=3046209 RepID=UPI0024BBCCF2|nr:DUF4328 domain-containing protein [Rhodococcus sp. G-MC3]MDJ0394350.1 DUF4328 domain-containing protein [Rhodococcus sp. G-MC3]